MNILKFLTLLVILTLSFHFDSAVAGFDTPPPREDLNCNELEPGSPEYEEYCNSDFLSIQSFDIEDKFHDHNGNLVKYEYTLQVKEVRTPFGKKYSVKEKKIITTVTCTFECTNSASLSNLSLAVLNVVYQNRLRNSVKALYESSQDNLVDPVVNFYKFASEKDSEAGIVRIVDSHGNLIAVVSYQTAPNWESDDFNIKIVNTEVAEVIEFTDGTLGYSFSDIVAPSDGGIFNWLTANFTFDCRSGYRITRDPITNEIIKVVTTASCGYFPN